MSIPRTGYVSSANDILLEGRIAYTFIEERIHDSGAEPLHIGVIEPVEAVLSSNPRFAEAESTYQEALTTMATGFYGASITSPGLSLKQALGAGGRNLRALESAAKRRGFLVEHDEKRVATFKNIDDWITAAVATEGEGTATHMHHRRTLDVRT
jgi:hypothetical protein